MVTPVAVTIDVERWSDAALATGVADTGPDTVVEEVEAVLAALAEHHARATFFVLGTVARDHPALVRTIARAGHEIGSHGWTHAPLSAGPRDRLARDLARSRALLQDLSGQPVLAFRAPTWSLSRAYPEHVDLLAAVGFTVDSSVFPVWTPLYGDPAAPRQPYWLEGPSGSRLLECPPATLAAAGIRIPAAGGIWWRVFPPERLAPYVLTLPFPVVYWHPWELARVPAAVRGVRGPQRLSFTWGRERLRRFLATWLAQVPSETLATRITTLAPERLPRVIWAAGRNQRGERPRRLRN
jgi:polysaccharide deacetylase family protein (PEP-CTERM system associated)